MSRRLGRSFVWFWTAETLSSVGDGLRGTAMSLLAAHVTRDPVRVAGVTLAGGLPWLLTSLAAGVLVDRVDRRNMVIAVRLMLAAVSGGFGLLVLTGRADLGAIYGASFLTGLGSTLIFAAYPAMILGIVPRDRLHHATSRLSAASMTAADFIGPPVAALLFSIAFAVPFLVDAGTFFVCAALLLVVDGEFKPRRDTSVSGQSAVRQVSDGIRWVLREPVVRELALLSPVLSLVFMASFSIRVLFALEVLGLSPVGYGLLSSAVAAGSIIGGLAAPYIADRIGRGTTLALSTAAEGLLLLIISVSADVRLVVVCFVLSGCTGIVSSITSFSLYQGLTPVGLVGRVTATFNVLGQGAGSVGALVGGSVARLLGLRAPFALAGVVNLLAVMVLVLRVSNGAVQDAEARFRRREEQE